MIPSILSLFIIGLHDVRCALIQATRRVCIAFPCDQLSGSFLVFNWVCSGLLGRALVERAKAKIASADATGCFNDSGMHMPAGPVRKALRSADVVGELAVMLDPDTELAGAVSANVEVRERA